MRGRIDLVVDVGDIAGVDQLRIAPSQQLASTSNTTGPRALPMCT
jgi:hypothetical protein